MDDSGGAQTHAPWRQHLLLVVDKDCEPAFEDVERIRVLPVEVRICSGTSVREKRLR